MRFLKIYKIVKKKKSSRNNETQQCNLQTIRRLQVGTTAFENNLPFLIEMDKYI